MLSLRPYQQEAVAAVKNSGLARPLVALPTGTGKTICFAQLIKDRGGRALVLAHRDELLQQAEDKLRTVWPEVPSVGVVKAERNEVAAQVVLGSVQTLAREKRLEKLLEAGTFDLVVVDEAHHAGAASYVRILERVAAPLTVGFTATPERADGKGLGFDQIVYRKGLFEMIGAQYLCDLRAKFVQLQQLDLGQVKCSGGDYQDAALGAAMSDAGAPGHVAAAWKEHAAGRPTLVFTPTVDLAYATAAALGSGFGVVEGEQKTEERQSVLARFRCGELQGIVNCGVLLEGYDEPKVSCIAVARPTKSRVLYQQMIGRGTRIYPGKEDCLILDFTGATLEHDLVTLARLLNVKPSTAEGGVTALLRKLQSAEQRVEVAGETIAVTVDLLKRQRLHWIKDGTRFLLSAGEETLALVPGGAAVWDVRSLGRDGSRKVFAGLTLEYAQGAAEDYVRKLGVQTLAREGASWRGDPASQAQLSRLQQWGLATPEGMTKGEASDAMTRHFNRRKW